MDGKIVSSTGLLQAKQVNKQVHKQEWLFGCQLAAKPHKHAQRGLGRQNRVDTWFCPNTTLETQVRRFVTHKHKLSTFAIISDTTNFPVGCGVN